MKKLIALSFILLASFNFAQNSFGVTAGGQTSGITNAKIGDNQNGYGAYAGFYYRTSLNDRFSFQTELAYSYQNIRNLDVLAPSGIAENSLMMDYKYQLHYIKLPLLLRYQPNKIYGEIGPELTYLLSGKIGNENEEAGFKNDSDLKNINALQFNVAIGAGYQINEKLSTGFRFTWGITPIADNLPYDIKVFNIALGINYTIF
jgi:hypothetical protein